MSIRRQTLEEWFTDYQLLKLGQRHFYLPAFCRVDISLLADRYESRGKRLPLTAIVIKSAAVLAKLHPDINRALVRAPWGTRIIEFEEAHVNLPIAVTIGGKKVLSAVVIKNADTLSIEALEQEIVAARNRPLHKMPIARILATKPNALLYRLMLRTIHFFAHRLPHNFYKHGGGISVSSVTRARVSTDPGLALIPSYGPTAFTICPGVIEKQESGKTYLHVGVGIAHCTVGGVRAVRALDDLQRIIANAGDLLGENDSPSADSPKL